MMREMTAAEIEAANERDRAIFAALSVSDKYALASIRYRLACADDQEALFHLVRQTINGVHYDGRLPAASRPQGPGEKQ